MPRGVGVKCVFEGLSASLQRAAWHSPPSQRGRSAVVSVGEKTGDDKTEQYLPPLQKGAMTFQQKGIQARAGWSKDEFDQSNFILTSLPILFHQPPPPVQFTSWAHTSLCISNNTINEPKDGAHKSSNKKNEPNEIEAIEATHTHSHPNAHTLKRTHTHTRVYPHYSTQHKSKESETKQCHCYSVHGTKSKTRSGSNQMFILERKWSVNSCLLSLLTCLTFQEDLPLKPYPKLGVQAWNSITKEHPPHRNRISRIRLLVILFLWPFSHVWKPSSPSSPFYVYFPSTESERPGRASGSLSARQLHSCKWQLAY